MIPAESPPGTRGSAWRLNAALAVLLVLAVATRLVSPAVFLDIGSLWPVGVGLVGVGWVVKRVGAGQRLMEVPVVGLLFFSWMLICTAFHLAGLPGLPSQSADLRGPPADQGQFDAFTVTLEEGRLRVSAGSGPAAYRVGMLRGGGGAGVPVAVERRGADGGEVTVSDARQPPLPPGLGVPVEDNAWLRFAGWDVTLHPQSPWRLSLSAPRISADLRNLPVEDAVLNGEGSVSLGEATGPVRIVLNGVFTVEVPPQAPVTVMGAAIVPENWTVEEATAWTGEPQTGWQVEIAEGGSAQVTTAAG